MTAFWVIGIGINLVVLVALGVWVARNWNPRGRERDDDAGRGGRR